MSLSYPNSLANGNTIDAPEIMANFNAVKTYLDTTKLSASANLSTPYSLIPFIFDISGSVTGGATQSFYVKVPAGFTFIPVSAQVAFKAVSAGAPVITLQATVSAANVLTTAASASTAATVNEKIAFDIASIAAASTIVVTVTNTAGGGNTATDVTGALIVKAYLTA